METSIEWKLMDESTDTYESYEALQVKCGQLAEELQSSKRVITELEEELAETNRGVVALYAELDAYSDQLQEASELKSRFLTYMSHEFRTPLGAILSVARILADRMDGELTEEQEKQVRFIEKATLELTDMVNDLLDLARIEAGRVTIAPAWFDMVDLLSAIRGLFKPIILSSGVSLIFDRPEGVSKLYTDDSKLSIILRNLISNAIKFTQHGHVIVSARSVDHDKIAFAVSDTGIGIAKEHLPSLFDDWMQISSATQKRLRGSGLGLSLCRRYAELLGGSITAASELGKGSTFTLVIPKELQISSPPAENPL